MTRPVPQWGGDRRADGDPGEVASGNRAVVTARWFLFVVAVLVALVLVIGAARAMLANDPDPDPDLRPYPSPSPSSWSPECTEEDLADGMCLTYDDIRNQPFYTQEPTP